MCAQAKQRSCCWDNIKGFLMLITVFAHVLFQLQDKAEAINMTVDCIYMFHMPAFVFVSGFFGKSANSRSFAGIVKLLFLYFIFNSAAGFAYGFQSLLIPMYSYWYLIALTVWRLTAHHLAKFEKINLILIAAALFAGYYPSIDNTLSISRIIGFYPFYMAGYRLSTEQSAVMTAKPYRMRLRTGIPAALAAAAAALAAYRIFGYSDGDLIMYAYADARGTLGRIGLYLTACLAILALRQLSPDRSIPLLTASGRNSMWIFVLHRPLTLLLSRAIGALSVGFVFLIAAASAVLICLVLGNDLAAKYLNRFAEQGTAIFTSDEKTGLNPAKLALLLVFVGYAVYALISAEAALS